ncbi:InlB B-repeat-containing protein, partial [Pseudobutyrivibrio sp.]
MHIKRLLSGSLAALMVASSFNVPVVRAAEDEPTEVVEEAKVDTSGDDDVIVDDVPEVETEETTEVSEPEEVTGLVEETSDEGTTEETLVVEEETKEQEVVKGEATGFAEGAKAIVAFAEDTDATFPTIDAEGIAIADSKFAIAPATKTGYTFTGYTVSCDDSDVTGVYDAGYVTLTDANSTRDAQLSTVNVTLTAQWSEWTRPVTYDLNYETTDSAPTGKIINWSDTVAEVGPATAPTREGYTLGGWSTSNSATNGMAGNEIVTAADQESVVLYAIWTENTSEAIDITGNTFTYSFSATDGEALTYTGKNISPKVVVKNGDDVVDSSNYEVKYFADSDCSGDEATLKNAGTYYAKITAKGTAYTGEKKGVEVKVARLPLTKSDIKLTAPMGSNTGNEIDGFNLFYDEETKSAEGTNPATVKGVTTKKVIPMVSVIDSEDNEVTITDEQKSFANNNVVSTATTKASVTITFTAEQLKNYQIGDSETATTLTKEFTKVGGQAV